MKRFSLKKGSILVAILLVPSVLFLVFSLGKHHIKDVPVLAPIEVRGTDTIYQTLPNIVFETAQGTVFSLDSLRGKILVVDFFTNPCNAPCMKKGAMLANLQNEFKDKESLAILSISLDTAMGQPEMQKLADKHVPKHGMWYFLKTRKLATLVGAAFAGKEDPPALSDLPTTDYILFDHQQRIRGYFDSRMLEDNKTLQDAIKVLMREPYIPHKNKEND